MKIRIKKKQHGFAPQVKFSFWKRWEYIRLEFVGLKKRYIADELPNVLNDKGYAQIILSEFVLYTNQL